MSKRVIYVMDEESEKQYTHKGKMSFSQKLKATCCNTGIEYIYEKFFSDTQHRLIDIIIF